MPSSRENHLPSPSLSPPGPRVMSRQHSGNSQHSHQSFDDDDCDPARSALEIRREKNRIKQRNLRLRRANQMADLERTVQSLRTNSHDLEDRLAQLESREASLAAWVRDLEAALTANGQRDHVESLRRVWAPSSASAHDSHAPQQSNSSTRDPLATLATAAASSYRPSVSQRWEDDEAHARKRRRHEDEYPAHSQSGAPGTRESHSPSRAMRIDQICLPLPRPSAQSSTNMMPSEHWSWSHPGHMSSADHQSQSQSHSYHHHQYESKPRVAPPQPDVYDKPPRASAPREANRSISPNERRPLSASSSAGTARSWTSPVQSFDVRL